MSKKTAITAANFNKILTDQVRVFGRFRDRLQDLLDFAMVQASNANYTYVNDVINAKLTGVNRQGIQIYIEDHCDLQLIKENGVYKFKSKKSKGFKYSAPQKSWYEYAKTAEPKALDPETAVLSVIRRLKSAQKGEGNAFIAKGHKEEAKKVLAHLAKTPGLPKDKLQEILAA